MTTHEIEQMLGMTKQALIYYEKEGMIKPQRDENNYRNYSYHDVDMLRLIQLLRSMDVSIDEIKLILNNKLSIRKALETKKDFINKEQKELKVIEKNINDYIQRKKVYIVLEDEEASNDYINLHIIDNCISFLDIRILNSDITGVDISLCSSKGEGSAYYGVLNLYFVDLDIHTKKDSYSFQLMNNGKVNDLFDFILNQNININDPIGIIDAYKTYKDSVKLNNYINRHYKEWAKVYHLDNPRDNYWAVMSNNYVEPLNRIKSNDKPTVKEQINKLGDEFLKLFKASKNN